MNLEQYVLQQQLVNTIIWILFGLLNITIFIIFLTIQYELDRKNSIIFKIKRGMKVYK